jgi:hypothetical protein
LRSSFSLFHPSPLIRTRLDQSPKRKRGTFGAASLARFDVAPTMLAKLKKTPQNTISPPGWRQKSRCAFVRLAARGKWSFFAAFLRVTALLAQHQNLRVGL